MTRIAFIDLVFAWPPRGGSWIHLKEVMEGLVRRGHEVKLFVPHFTRYLPRGVIQGEFSFQVELIPFTALSFNRFQVPRAITAAVDAWKPDRVSIDDGYFLKPWLVRPLAKRYPVYLRLYAYEMLCGYNKLLPGALFGADSDWVTPDLLCENHILKDWKRCRGCFLPFRRAVKYIPAIALGYRNKTTVPFVHEYAMAMAFTKAYAQEVAHAFQAAAKVIVYNQEIRQLVEPYAREVVVAPPGIWPDRFRPDPPDPDRKQKIVLFTGRTTDQVKGGLLLRAAVNLLRSRRKDFCLMLTEQPLAKLAPFESHVYPVGWHSPDRLPELYAQADLCVVPSIWPEPFGITALEAMAAGRPVVASRTGGLAQSVVHGETGLHFESGDILGLAAAIERLLDDRELRIKMGRAGRARTESVYHWDRLMENLYGPLYEE